MNLFDVLIIGGGLAGSATALHLSKQGYSVLILEKENNIKLIPCAGGMAASVKSYLPLNINEAIETKVENVHFTWKSIDEVIANLSGESPFYVVKRETLDALLIEKAIIYGAKIIKPVNIKDIINKNDIWEITCNGKNIFKSKFLVVADGSESSWTSFFRLGPPKPKYAETIAIRMEGKGNIEKNSVRFDFGSVRYGFAWAFPLKNSVNIGLGSFIGKANLDNISMYNQIINNFGFKDSDYNPTYRKLRIWNGFYKLHCERVVVIGDAASLCDPFLAEGIRPALISSYYAAKCIHECFTKNSYDLSKYSTIMKLQWSSSMSWGKRIAEVFYRFPRTGYKLGVKRKTAPRRIAQILSGEMSYEDIARRVIKRLLFQSSN